MKNFLLLLAPLFLLFSCRKDDDAQGVSKSEYKQKMRDLVMNISRYAKSVNPDFLIVPQNGIELVSSSAEDPVQPHAAYLDAIDAIGQEDLLYGYDNDNQVTSADRTNYLMNYLNIAKDAGKQILVTDYCFTPSKMDRSYQENNKYGFISFAADQRELTGIPAYPFQPNNENTNNIYAIKQAANFLYLLNTENFTGRSLFIDALQETNYDVLIIDSYFTDGTAFTPTDIIKLKRKKNGGRRLVISYMCIGEAENYRYYWKDEWKVNKPNWMGSENPDWPGNFKVKYWDPEWQQILFGNDNSYIKKIADAGFDGAYLDIIDAFEYW
jgi:Predicted extracellular endo alpha-1,4 polygalactosaminidase or related polysaccharide hydrolase